jgi:hypothetical protein
MHPDAAIEAARHVPPARLRSWIPWSVAFLRLTLASCPPLAGGSRVMTMTLAGGGQLARRGAWALRTGVLETNSSH